MTPFCQPKGKIKGKIRIARVLATERCLSPLLWRGLTWKNIAKNLWAWSPCEGSGTAYHHLFWQCRSVQNKNKFERVMFAVHPCKHTAPSHKRGDPSWGGCNIVQPWGLYKQLNPSWGQQWKRYTAPVRGACHRPLVE